MSDNWDNSSNIAADVAVLLKWQRDPKLFVRDIWKLDVVGDNEEFVMGKHITKQQEELLDAVGKAVRGEASPRISVRAGKGVGKSCSLSWILLWFLFCYEESQVPCTAPTGDQLYDVLWKECSRWISRMPENVKEQYEWQSSYIRIKDRPAEWFARARTAKKEAPEALAGVHSPTGVMCLVDEACYDEETEVLTDNGFKLFKDLTNTDKVLSRKESGEAEYVLPSKIHIYEGERELYTYKCRGADFAVTANHKMLYATRTISKFRLKEISNLDKSGNIKFPRRINIKAQHNEVFEVPEFNSGRKIYPKMIFDFNDWVEFVGWYLSEGCLINHGYINITQSSEYNPEKCKELEALFSRMGLKYFVYKNDYQLNYRQIGEELRKYGKGFKNKSIPEYIKRSSSAERFLDTFAKGDGYFRKNRRIFYTSSPKMASDLQEMLYLSGKAGTITKRPIEKAKWVKDHFVQTKNQAYAVVERLATDIKYRGNEHLKVINHKGKVYCVTTPNGTVFVRRNGHCMWSGNSGVPDEIFKMAEGSLTGKLVLMIMISNPTRTSGYFYESHKGEDASEWQKLHFNALDSPVVDEKYVERTIFKYGEDSDDYRVTVLGEFPREDAIDKKGYVPLITEDMMSYTTEDKFVGRCYMGVDPSGEGDDETVWVVRDKFKARIVASEKTSTAKGIAQKTMTLMDLYDIPGDRVTVDNFGIGANVVAEMGGVGMYVLGKNVGDKADDDDRYANKRAEAFYRMREWLKKGGLLYVSEEWKELLNLKFRRNERGKIQIMGKLEMRSMGIASPNKADSLMLTFCEDGDDEYYSVTTGWGDKEDGEEENGYDRFAVV